MSSLKTRRRTSRASVIMGGGMGLAMVVALPLALETPASGAEQSLSATAQVAAAPVAEALDHAEPVLSSSPPVVSKAAERTTAAAKAKAAKRAAAKRAAAQRAAVETRAAGRCTPTSNYTLTARYGQPGPWSRGYHTGLDFAAPVGTPIVSASAGTVESAGWEGAYGNAVVIVNSDGTRSRYAHMSSSNVTAGQTVSCGQQIGTVGVTGNTTGPHLHFEVMTGDEVFTDPGAWLG